MNTNPLLQLNNPSVGKPQHNFSQIPQAQIQRSMFDASHGHKTTLGAGFLVPIMADFAYPGDTYDMQNLAAVIRMITPIVPTMDNLYADWFFFFVPIRLLWIHWANMMGEQDSTPSDTTDYVMPKIETTAAQLPSHGIYDYMGVPPITNNTASNTLNALYGRGVNLIWNKWFRDQNLQDAVTVETDDGPDPVSNYTGYGVNSEVLPRRGKRYDYFTSALPWPQKINDGTVVGIPLTGTAPLVGLTGYNDDTSAGPAPIGPTTLGTFVGTTAIMQTTATGSAATGNNIAINLGTAYNGNPVPYANLGANTATTINALRLAITMQQLFETDARGGTYLPNILSAHFGVVSPDARLQYPEYLGGGETRITISAIPQTSATGLTGGDTPAGNLSAFAAGHETGQISWSKSFVEWGIVYGFVSIRADLTYQQGARRQFFDSTRYNLYWPTFANLGEMSVQMREIYYTGVDANDQTVWGYQEQWAHLRYYPSEITAGMRSNASPSFAIWHLSQDLVTPALNDTFIEDNPPIERITAVETLIDQFYADIWFQMKRTRPLPMYSVPGLTRL